MGDRIIKTEDAPRFTTRLHELTHIETLYDLIGYLSIIICVSSCNLW